MLFIVILIFVAAILLSTTRRAREACRTEMILAALPQTQCGRCNYAGCRPYAEAIAENEADIDRCPPGGTETIDTLANLLGVISKPLGVEYEDVETGKFAWIDETRCIGCVKCLHVCPTDAILGAAKQMHTVIADACTGCELCLAPCPMDCILMVPGQVVAPSRWT